ncbi:efflux transporter outer membrane subunit [Pandoraea apista]|uniref:efflux transporter outer membrane subunit n=1 Tax=Pandoraea apista TaxID=93218 RepID=UPI0005A8096B|nr:efflux transporter outer membrane subunit [Pandoraea apista]AJZ74887.1 RND transporter [Pandoraea apista]AKH74181.1 RND transporter [Pandoraea apista]AKI62730.1 RND transporter [Pandoraea apista]
MTRFILRGRSRSRQFIVARLSPLAVLAPLVLAGCSFAPSDKPPAMPSPAHYGVNALPANTVSAQGTSQQFDVGAPPVKAWWQAYRSDKLNALVDEGLRNSPNLASANHALQAAREQLKAQIGESLFPSIDIGGQAARERNLGIPTFGPPTALYNMFVGQIQARYTFDFFGASRFANASLAAQVDQQAFQLESARQALAANIVSGAIGASVLGAQVKATERLVELAQADATDMARREALGAVSRADALASAQTAESLAASLPGLRAQWQSTRHALAVLLGRTPDQAPDDLSLGELKVPERVPVAVPSTLLQTRPDIQAAEMALKAASAEVGVATAQMFPSLSLTASMGKGGFNWPTVMSNAGSLWSIAGSLTQPLFHGGALLAQRRAAKETYEAAVDQYKQTVLTAFKNVADTLASLEADNTSLLHADNSSAAAEQIYRDTAARVRLGALPVSAARAREQQYWNAYMTTVRATGARLSDTALLFYAMGVPPEPAADAAAPASPETAIPARASAADAPAVRPAQDVARR